MLAGLPTNQFVAMYSHLIHEHILCSWLFCYIGCRTDPYGLLLTWLNDHIHYQVYDGITYPFQIFNVAVVEVLEWINNFILLGEWLLIQAGIKVNPCW